MPTEQLIQTIVREVMAELSKRGVQIGAVGPGGAPGASAPAPTSSRDAQNGGAAVEIDMSPYRTPVLTEGQLARIGREVATVIVPCNTVVTPGARGVIRAKKLTLVRKVQSHR